MSLQNKIETSIPCKMAGQDLTNAVRHWVHFDNLTETLNKQVTNARSMRSKYETEVLDIMERQNIKQATIKITGANIQCASRFKPNDLTWGFLEEQLHQYFKSTGKRDETTEMVSFLQQRRVGKTTEYLKKTALSTQQPTPR